MLGKAAVFTESQRHAMVKKSLINSTAMLGKVTVSGKLDGHAAVRYSERVR